MDGGTGNRASDQALAELLSELEAVRDGKQSEVRVSDRGGIGAVAQLVNELLRRRAGAPQESVLKYIIEHVPHSIFWKDWEGRFLGGNRNLVRDVGLASLEQLLGKTDYDLGFPREQVDHFRKCDLDVMKSGKPLLDLEESQNQADGTHTLLTSKVPLRDQAGQVIGLLGIYVDITERKRIEEELREARDAAEAANRAKGEFLTVISHELRTPLTLILGPLDWILSRSDAELPGEVRASLERMRRNAGRLLTLVNDLLDFTVIEAGRMQVDWESVDVADLVGQLVSDAGPAAEQAGIDLRFTVENDPGFVVLDRRKFEKIALNLLGNALKFTPRGGRVVVTVGAAGDDLQLSVADTGPGIPREKQGLLFQRFQQIDGSTRRKHEGTGIGLALVKDLAEILGGAAGVESEPGRGSRFHVRIPRASDRAGAPRPPAGEGESFAERFQRISEQFAATAPAVPPAAAASPRPRVLVADDNADMRGYLTQILAGEYEIEAVGDGRSAIEAARARPPAVIVSDVMMPEVDGLELVWRLKQDPALRQIPILLLTAKASRAELVSGLELGADDYLGKPFSPEELCARVRSARRLGDVYRELAARHRELEGAHQELRQTQAELVQAARVGAIGAVVAGLSHEVSKPLGILLSNTQMLLDRLDDAAARRSLLTIEGQARRCLQIVGAQLDLSRTRPAPQQPLVAAAIMDRVVELAGPRARKSQIDLRSEGAVATAGLRIAACPQEVETAVLNVVNNALDATPAGGTVSLSARARAHEGRPGLELVVKDTGRGIPPEVLPEVFDPLYTTKGDGQTTGLGLTITRRVLDDYQGRVDIESSAGGTTVRLWLPAEAGDADGGGGQASPRM